MLSEAWDMSETPESEEVIAAQRTLERVQYEAALSARGWAERVSDAQLALVEAQRRAGQS